MSNHIPPFLPRDTSYSNAHHSSATQPHAQPSTVLGPIFNPNTLTETLTTIAMTLISEAQRQKYAVFQTHKKDAGLFAGRKIHSYTLPDGTCHLFVKQKETEKVAAKKGISKDMLPADHYVWDPKTNTFQRLNDVARLRFFSSGELEQNASVAEIKFLQQLKGHKHITEMIAHGIYTKQTRTGTTNKTVMYQELYEMNLTEFISSKRLNGLEAPQKFNVILSMAEQMLQAVDHAHAHNIIVNDFKADNVLLTLLKGSAPHIALSDFDLSKLSTEINSEACQGSLPQLAPEKCLRINILNQNAIQDPHADFYIQPTLGKPVDIWAVGITLYQLTRRSTQAFILPVFFLSDVLEIHKEFQNFQSFYNVAVKQHTNTIPVPATVTDPIELEIQKMIAHEKLILDTLKTVTISNPLEPFSPDAPDYKLCLIANQWTKGYIALLKSLTTLCQQYPQATRQDNLRGVFASTMKVSGLRLAVSQKMILDYLQALEKLPIPSVDEDPINHLILRMLHPNAKKRITASDALKVIEEYRANQTSNTSQHSGKKRRYSTQDDEDRDE